MLPVVVVGVLSGQVRGPVQPGDVKWPDGPMCGFSVFLY